MNKKRTKQVTLLLLSIGLAHVYGGTTQVGDFRIGQSVYPANTFFDPGFDEPTRSVAGAPVNIVSRFTGTSEEAGRGDIPDTTTGTDIGLLTFEPYTQVLAMNRFFSSTTGTSGVARIGAVQWNIDLAPLETYLASNSLMLTELDFDLVLGLTGSDPHDFYLSYTDATAGTTLTGLNTTNSQANYFDFWWAANGAADGDIIDGKFEVIKKGLLINGDSTVSKSLLDLYNSGVREFNLSFMTGGYHPVTDITKILEGSGLSMTTVVDTGPALSDLYDTWITGYNLTNSVDSDPYTDYDHDGLSNLEEYGLGGNPTNAAEKGYKPEFSFAESGGTNWAVYIYPQNQDAHDAGLNYFLELTDDLIAAPWENTGYEIIGTGVDAYSSGFNAVTNRIPTEVKAAQFIQLQINGL